MNHLTGGEYLMAFLPAELQGQPSSMPEAETEGMRGASGARQGTVGDLICHPVKAMRGQAVQASYIGPHGLYGDRSHWLTDDTRPGEPLSADIFPGILGYQAHFDWERTNSAAGHALSEAEAFPPLAVTAPDGACFAWGEPELAGHIGQASGRAVTPASAAPQEPGNNWEDHLLITTASSLQALAGMLGWPSLDHRRFRANVVLANEEAEPFIEEAWIGRILQLGDALVRINKPCGRCMYVNIDPDRLTLHPEVLKAVVRQCRNNFGVYASVIRPGAVRVGDPVILYGAGDSAEASC
ncbi:MOSC domain-containing protein [Paenibacillus sp. y28]|uniref:MOSC domain-containing protein n=1 Tax=Paenibacillus sp. y28 TaxID=3129110 RepID=UPI00301A77F1